MDFLSLLRSTRIFTGLSDAQLHALIAAGDFLHFAGGITIFTQGEHSRDLYVVLEGEVEISLDPGLLPSPDPDSARPRVVARLRTGASFGEMALLEGSTRSASVVSAGAGARVYTLSPERLQQLSDVDPQIGHLIFRNIGAAMSNLVREQHQALMRVLLRDYFVHVLAEELASQVAYCDPSTPIEKTITLRDPDTFLLARLAPVPSLTPAKTEVLRFVVFAFLPDLGGLFGDGEPSGFQILEHLFTLLRSGAPPAGPAEERMDHRFGPGEDRRSGVLGCRKQRGGRRGPYFLRWHVKGIEDDDGICTASILIEISAGDPDACERALQGVIEGLHMPIQRSVARSLPRGEGLIGAGFRVLTLHHRSSEVAYTLATLAEHGFTLDCHIGIPYGEASWAQARMLDHASGHAYYSLISTEHPVHPTEYRLDFAQSPFLDPAAEAEIAALFRRGERACDYLTAMTRVGELRLIRALEACLRDDQRLLVYEDGAYLVPILYAAYHDPSHRAHALVRRAIDEGILAGVVEVTTAGERRNRDLLKNSGSRPLVPVLSGASEDIKLIYEGLGVAEAVADATSTAFGNLGLPTFSARRVAVLGGNGAIGTRLVENIVFSHNSTANVVVVDIADEPFSRELDGARYPHAATRMDLRGLLRYFVGPNCLPVAFDRPLSGPLQRPDAEALTGAVERFLSGADAHDELAVSNAFVPGDHGTLHLLDEVAARSGHRRSGDGLLGRGAGRVITLVCGDRERKITLLARGVVFSYRDLGAPLRAGIDTVVGATGFQVFREEDLETFLDRPAGSDKTGVDLLALASASSKDYEFKRALTLLHRLLALLHDEQLDVEQGLTWLGELVRRRSTVILGPDLDVLAAALAAS